MSFLINFTNFVLSVSCVSFPLFSVLEVHHWLFMLPFTLFSLLISPFRDSHSLECLFHIMSKKLSETGSLNSECIGLQKLGRLQNQSSSSLASCSFPISFLFFLWYSTLTFWLLSLPQYSPSAKRARLHKQSTLLDLR